MCRTDVRSFVFVLVLALLSNAIVPAAAPKATINPDKLVGTWVMIRDGRILPKSPITYQFKKNGDLIVHVPTDVFRARYMVTGDTLSNTFDGADRSYLYTISVLSADRLTLIDLRTNQPLEFVRKQ